MATIIGSQILPRAERSLHPGRTYEFIRVKLVNVYLLPTTVYHGTLYVPLRIGTTPQLCGVRTRAIFALMAATSPSPGGVLYNLGSTM